MSYTTKDVYVMEEIEHIRNSTGMYIGSTETATRLVEEILDNSLDEVQAGYCDFIEIDIDTKNNIISIMDNGRGIPFNQKLPPEEDPPIMTVTKLFSSGKFDKKDGSAYQIASGLHGVGLVAVNALSDWMEIEIFRDGKCGKYFFKDATKEIERTCRSSKNHPSSTRIKIKPSEKYFVSTRIDVDIIEERLRIASANFENLTIYLKVDDISYEIKGETEEDLVKEYLTDSEDLEWICFENKKGSESCYLKLSWDDKPPISQKIFSCVNLVHVHSGVHIKYLHNAIKNVFSYFSKKYKYNFKPEDCFIALRCYLNMKIIKTSFEAQVKVKLESKSDISILNSLETYLKKYLEENEDIRTNLLEKFQTYRKTLQNKKLTTIGKSTRASTKFTKLRDCRNIGGELLIGEGDSAVGGLLHVRDPKKHAILPLRGVITNVLKRPNWYENTEVKEIIQALGTDVEENCDVSKLRYSKIILAADADPAGSFITTLLIVLFAKLVPDIIKAGKLFVCVTPLHGIRKNGKLVPLWNDKDLEDARSKGLNIKRFKGLGEFSPMDLKVFTLDEDTRRLIKIEWCDEYERLFKLMMSPVEKRKLILGEWKLYNDK
jgi:DNA gyrase subunit B